MKAQKANVTPSGELACAFGTPWLDHFEAGPGCKACGNVPVTRLRQGVLDLFGNAPMEVVGC